MIFVSFKRRISSCKDRVYLINKSLISRVLFNFNYNGIGFRKK